MAQEITITQSDLDKIHSTEKMTKATLIIVSVAAGIMLLLALIGTMHALVQPHKFETRQPGGMNGQRRILRGGIAPQQGKPGQASPATPQGQSQDGSDSVDINAL